MELIETDILTNQDISSPLLVSTYTADRDRLIIFQVYLSSIAGNEVYKICVTKQDGGAGTVYQSPTSFVSVSFGTTTVYLLSESVPVEENDIIKAYVEGTALDTSIDVITKIFSISKKRIR